MAYFVKNRVLFGPGGFSSWGSSSRFATQHAEGPRSPRLLRHQAERSHAGLGIGLQQEETVLPLFVISLVNLFVAGPPLKTVVLDSNGASYGASLPFLQLQVSGAVAKFNLIPKEEMTQFFVVACYAPGTTSPLYFDATVMGKAAGGGGSKELAVQSTRPEKPLLKEARSSSSEPTKQVANWANHAAFSA